MRSTITGLLLATTMLTTQPHLRAADTTPGKIVSVADYGAIPGDGKDDGPAIVAAATAAAEAGATLVFPKGVYDIFEDTLPPTKRCVDIADTDGMVIEGNGSTLIGHGHISTFWFMRCKNVTVRNFTIDWQRPPFSQGKVLSSDARTITVQVDPQYLISGQERLQGMMDYDPATHAPIGLIDAFESGIVKKRLLRPQVLEVTFKKDLAAPPPPGTLIVLRHEIYGWNAMEFIDCAKVTVEDVTVHCSPGMAFHTATSRDLTLRRFRIAPTPDSGRLMSCTADGLFFSSCTGTVTIDDSWIEANGDDGINVSAKNLTVKDVPGPSELTAFAQVGWAGIVPQPGDKVEIASVADLVPKMTATVASASYDKQAKVHRIKFDAPLPQPVKAGDVIVDVTQVAKLRVTNTTITKNRARGIIVSTWDVAIDRCHISEQTMNGVLITSSPNRFGSQGPGANGLSITNCAFGGTFGSAILAYVECPNPAPGVHRNVTIAGNTFTTEPALDALRQKSQQPEVLCFQSAIYLGETDGATIDGNVFNGYGIAAFLGASKNVKLADNRSTGDSAVVVDQGSVAPTLSGNTCLAVSDKPAAWTFAYLQPGQR